MLPNIELLKPRDFGEIINDTFIFIRQNFKPLMKYFFTFCGFFLLAAGATTVLQQLKMTSVLNNINSINTNSYSQDYGPFAFLGLGFFLNLLFLWLEYISITVTVLCYVTLYKQKGNMAPATEEMWGYFKFYFFKVLGSSFILFVLLIVGTAFCVIPGIYLYAIFSLTLPIMVVENTSFGYAFNQSFKLIKENWWSTFGVLIVVGIIVSVSSSVLVFPATLINTGNLFLHFTKGTTLSVVVSIITTLMTQISHVFQIISIVATALIYFNLTESKEGTGLMERINQFGNINPDTSVTPEEY